MAFLTALDVAGDTINLARTHAAHLGGVNDTIETGKSGDFGAMFMDALNGVNRTVTESSELSTMLVTNPDAVDTHDVTIALAQANLAVSLTKAIVDRALQAYTNIINLR
ncbi:MAG: flagellar hook-basal body complex protein FliE [Spirochaetales bacterium]|nr:flagellar hook-basal body complex protein FliE [Spirochaetales bacterium]